ncbi:MAG: hypothetical protein ACTS27_09415, partial [Phycisphaerales bacterium]
DSGDRVLPREPGAGEITSNQIPEEALAALAEKAKELGVPAGGGRGMMRGGARPAGMNAQNAGPGADKGADKKDDADDKASAPATAQDDTAKPSAEADEAVPTETRAAAPTKD